MAKCTGNVHTNTHVNELPR